MTVPTGLITSPIKSTAGGLDVDGLGLIALVDMARFDFLTQNNKGRNGMRFGNVFICSGIFISIQSSLAVKSENVG